MASQPQPLVAPSPMAQLLEQLALDDLQSTALSKDSLDSSIKILTEESGPFLSSPTRLDSPSLFANSTDSSLTAESTLSSSRPSREGSCIISAGPSQNSSTTSLHKSSSTPLPVPRHEPIRNRPHSLHITETSPALRRGTSILRSSSNTDQSAFPSSDPPSPPSPTSPSTPSVKFAPLPQIERTKKRKHSQRLGVAARSQLLARRRQLMREAEDADRPPQHIWRSDEEEEDPLVTLGHMMKIASIRIWRKVAKKTRPGMQERSNSDSVLDITEPVTCTDTDDEVLVELVEDTSDEKTPPPQTETTTTTGETTNDEVVVVETEVTGSDPDPTDAS